MFQVCIWDYYGHRKHALMTDLDKTLDDANIQMDQDVSFRIVNMLTVKGFCSVCFCLIDQTWSSFTSL